MGFVKLSLRKKKKVLADPGGVLATLQGMRRLLVEWDNKAVYPALDESLEMAVPKDRARAWWATHRALINALPVGHTTVSGYVMLTNVKPADVVALVDSAIKSVAGEGVRR